MKFRLLQIVGLQVLTLGCLGIILSYYAFLELRQQDLITQVNAGLHGAVATLGAFYLIGGTVNGKSS